MSDSERIIQAVCAAAGLQRHLLMSPTRGPMDVARARQVAMYLAWTLSPKPCYTQVGRSFGRDRTTVRHAVEKVSANMTAKVQQLEAQLVRTASPV